MATFSPTQGRYLAFIHAYTTLHGCPPAESDIAKAMCVSPPSVNQMVKNLEKKGLILRQPGTARSLRVLVPEDEIPSWRNDRKQSAQATTPRSPATMAKTWMPREVSAVPVSPPATLYVLAVYLMGGPIPAKFSGKEISRVIEICGDQTLHDLHMAIFYAFGRFEEHLYEFHFGKRPFDKEGPNYGPGERQKRGAKSNAAEAVTLDDLQLKTDRTFGYCFDFGDEWYHQIRVEKIDRAIPTVTYPRVIKRVGKAPPQYSEE